MPGKNIHEDGCQPGMDSVGLDPLVYGRCSDSGIVAFEHQANPGGADEMIVFRRQDGRTIQERAAFEPFIVANVDVIADCPVEYRAQKLAGVGALNVCAWFRSWEEFGRAKTWLGKATGFAVNDPGSPFLCINDPVQQYAMASGRTSFKGLRFEDLHRLQLDIECETSPGYEFCNAEREGDRIIAIGLADETGWTEVLAGPQMSEKQMLERLVAIVRERDPDVIEGHNIFNFDLPYVVERARRHKIKLSLGRDGSKPRKRPSRFSVGERTIAYSRFEIFGRHVVDTLFLVHAYDISHRTLSGFGLKEVAVHFGVAARDRTYVEGTKIAEVFRTDPERLKRYVRDDVVETRAVSGILSMSHFVQAQMLPYSYQNICVRGNAMKIDSLMIREYLAAGHALTRPDMPREFAGGYTDIFAEGVVQQVHHCDVRSLYPSLMLSRRIAPGRDDLGVFLKLLDQLRTFRLEAKRRMKEARTEADRNHMEALQSTFKVLINSFYGYLGFSQARFSDFDAAEAITRQGRELLQSMIAGLRSHGARPIEIDTDGIYFVPPLDAAGPGPARERFRRELMDSLPEGIEIEFDGEYRSMYSYKMKNYALLSDSGEMIIKGAALKSRGLEPFQRAFVEESIRLRLEGRENEVAQLKSRYEKSIREREWPIERLAKTENLQDSPATYASKKAQAGRSRSAVYELALKSGREYRAGDQISYYVTGSMKSVAVHENAKLVSEWDPANRDENVAYYLAKLEALNAKFGALDTQGELNLQAAADGEE